MNESVNDKGVCRTPPATTGMLVTQHVLIQICMHKYKKKYIFKEKPKQTQKPLVISHNIDKCCTFFLIHRTLKNIRDFV